MAHPDNIKSKKNFFTRSLMRWHSHENTRHLPWKGEKDPYRIWLSEIILQQTRAQQGLPYYEAFTASYPTVFGLAAANDDEVFRVWQGLGYYNRCRNMLATARHIVSKLNGVFPATYDGLLSLKGIGPYTAAAIGSFAFGLPTAVLDGNVYRVLARYFGIDTPSDTTEGKTLFSSLAADVLNPSDSAAHNQAIMDLGATVCTPAAPACDECPLRPHCFAAGNDSAALFPVRSKKIKVRERHFNYVGILQNGNIWVSKRPEGDIWSNLYEIFLIETAAPKNLTGIKKLLKPFSLPTKGLTEETSLHTQQKLTHQLIHSYFYTLDLSDTQTPSLPAGGMWVSISELKNLAFPKTLVSFFTKKLYF